MILFTIIIFFFFFKQKTAYEMLRSLVGSEMCIRDRFGTASVTDNCTAGLIAAGIVQAETVIGCQVSVTKAWTVQDKCGNIGTASQTITFTRLTPFVVPANGTTTVACLSNAVLPATILLPNIVDGCGNTLQPTGPPQIIDAPSPITCQGTRTYQYTYVDCAGNTKTWSYIYTIAAPVVVMPANGASTVACPSDAVAPTPPAIVDNCGKAIAPSAPVVSANPACAGTKTYTYTYIDCS